MTSIPSGKPRHSGSETGALPRVDMEPEVQHEPPEPPHLPEIDTDHGGVTGVLPIITEGEDEAKQSDDSSTAGDEPVRDE